MVEDLVKQRNARASASPPALRGAYRLLFLGGAAWAAAVVMIWVTSLAGGPSPSTRMALLAWHQHEMIFGFVGAIIAGFLSAAIPNWTGRPAFAGFPVAAFVLLWLAARLANLVSAFLPGLLAPALDVGFFLLLALAAGREIFAARNRNGLIVAVILLFAAANGLHHAESLGAALPSGIGMRLGFSLIILLITLIGGRIIPAFTRNWLVARGRAGQAPGPVTRFDMAALGLGGAALAGWTVFPGETWVGLLLIAAGLFHAARLARWSGLHAARDPLVLSLHLAYAWIPIGLVLLGLSLFAWVPSSPATHALAAGAMATMVLAVMSRASLGHGGRPLVANGATSGLFALITVAALLRVAGPLLPLDPALILKLAGLAWIGAFFLFILAYAPILLAPRADGRI